MFYTTVDTVHLPMIDVTNGLYFVVLALKVLMISQNHTISSYWHGLSSFEGYSSVRFARHQLI